jgi:hypothetical protein
MHFRTEENTAELAYREIAMHGASSDPANFGAPCALIQPEVKNYKWLLKPEDSKTTQYRRYMRLVQSAQSCSLLSH